MYCFERLKIASKLSVMVSCVILIFALLSGFILWSSLSDVMQQELKERGLSSAREIAQLSSGPIQAENLFSLDELVHTTKKNNKFIFYIFIVDKDNRVMADTFENGMPCGLLALHAPKGADKGPSFLSFTSDRGNIEDILYPIEDGALGYVRLGISEAVLEALLTKNFLKLFFSTIFVGLIGAAFVYKLTNVLTRPLKKLLGQAELISSGHLPQKPLRVSSDDEIGRLMAAMNTLAENLQKSEQQRKLLLKNLLNAQEDERKKISLELHDESGQALTALLLSLRMLANAAKDEENRSYILEVRDEAANILERLRRLAVELRPPALDELGIEAAIKNLIGQYQKYHELNVEFSCALSVPPSDLMNLAIYRIVQECLTNIVKHAHANCSFIGLTQSHNALTLTIKDNGIGITAAAIKKAQQNNHIGLYGIQERVRVLGGSMHLGSEDGWNTVYKITFPNEVN